jgi:hypothetical protein
MYQFSAEVSSKWTKRCTTAYNSDDWEAYKITQDDEVPFGVHYVDVNSDYAAGNLTIQKGNSLG